MRRRRLPLGFPGNGRRTISMPSSLNSVPFYQAQGYVVDEMTSVLLAGDVPLPCASMHKLLGG